MRFYPRIDMNRLFQKITIGCYFFKQLNINLLIKN